MGSMSETVCVTGASGFIGSWLVMRLMERGYMVRATVRDPGPFFFIFMLQHFSYHVEINSYFNTNIFFSQN